MISYTEMFLDSTNYTHARELAAFAHVWHETTPMTTTAILVKSTLKPRAANVTVTADSALFISL